METLETVTINDNLDSYVNLDRIKNASKAVSMNEAGIDNLAVETMQVAKLTNDYLNKIIDIMDNTKNYYKCEAGDALRANFDDLKDDFSITVQNIENYAYSLKKAKNNFTSRVDEAIQHVNTAAASVEDLIKKEGN
jgi:hypothetical protein